MAPIAQSVEQLPCKQPVGGAIPSGGTTIPAYIANELSERGWNMQYVQTWLGETMRMPSRDMKRILSGDRTMSNAQSRLLAALFDIDPDFFIKLAENYSAG